MSNRIGKNFSGKIRRDLSERVAYMCCNPLCRRLTIKPNSSKHIAVRSGKACHIISASPKGPRTDSTKSDDFIRSFGNGIWLCDKCSREIDDNENKYSVDDLLRWKQEAENYVETLVTQDTRLRQLRILTQSHLSALRILSGLPTHLDQTFNNPNGNGINITRLFMELELVLFENSFVTEAEVIRDIMIDLDTFICPWIDSNKTGMPINICHWKFKAVRVLMKNVMRFDDSAYERYLGHDENMVKLEFESFKVKQIVPATLHIGSTQIGGYPD